MTIDQQEPLAKAEGITAPRPARRSVLVIDDEEDIRLVARMSLTVSGFQVLEASGGREGIELATTHRPDAIVLDIMMPQMDGIATLQELKTNAATAGIPVIFLTAKNVPDPEQFLELGAAAILNKPFTPKMLAQQVNAVLPR